MPSSARKVRRLSGSDQTLYPGRSRGDVGIAPYAPTLSSRRGLFYALFRTTRRICSSISKIGLWFTTTSSTKAAIWAKG